MALIDRDSSPEVISYLPVDTLPEDITERLAFHYNNNTFTRL